MSRSSSSPSSSNRKPVYILLRFSALGDVAMALTVARQVARERPDALFVFVTRPFMTKLLEYDRMENLIPYPIKLPEEGSPLALFRLSRRLHRLYPHAEVLDLHDVLRTKILRCYFRTMGHPCRKIVKPRAARAALLRERSEDKVPSYLYVKPMLQIYKDLLCQSCAVSALPEQDLPNPQKGKASYRVGLAPYAQHQGKVLPLETISALLSLAEEQEQISFVLYGAPGKETEQNRRLVEGKRQSALSSAKGIAKELEEMAGLDLMVSMDSANMHLASLIGLPVLSIWGATHPAAGFLGEGQRESNAVGMDLTCRPCSIFGNIPCKRGDYLCLSQRPDWLFRRIQQLLGLS